MGGLVDELLGGEARLDLELVRRVGRPRRARGRRRAPEDRELLRRGQRLGGLRQHGAGWPRRARARLVRLGRLERLDLALELLGLVALLGVALLGGLELRALGRDRALVPIMEGGVGRGDSKKKDGGARTGS